MASANDSTQPPPLRRDTEGQPERASLSDVIEWFLDHDPRVNIIRHPSVEKLFQWKQTQEEQAWQESDSFAFETAEDRLAIGIFQALAAHASEPELHEWITDLLGALDESAKLNREIAEAYRLSIEKDASPLAEAEKIPTQQTRNIYLTACWLEALCTAEIRVLGWIYQNLYNKPYNPNTSLPANV